MKSFSTLRNALARMVNRSGDTTFQALGDEWLNDGIRTILGMPVNWKFLEASVVKTTTAGISTYTFPYNYDELIAVKIQNGTYQFTVRQVKNRDDWNRITAVTYQSDYPWFYYLNDRTIEIFPVPATTANNITFNYKKRAVDLANVDYVTGTVTATNNSATIAGAGTTFTAAMVGRFFKVNADGNWYLITGFTNATTITLEQPYQGLTVAGAAYTIGEMSVLPENDDMLPVFYAASQYWYQNNDIRRGREYERMFTEGVKQLKEDNITSSMDVGLESQIPLVNPNFYPQNIT